MNWQGHTDSHAATWQPATMEPNNDIIVIGYGKVPAASASHATSVNFALSLRVDSATHLISDVGCTAVTDLVRQWIAETVTGADITADPTPLLEYIDDRYLGVAAGAIKQAVLDAWRRYSTHQKEQR